jgi:hypothetical protein
MPMIAPMTELEAVNEMLMSIGQAPVNTLNVTGIRDVNIAKTRLQTTARRVLLQGWHFNTDETHEVAPDADGIVVVPPGALSVDASTPYDDLTVRRHEKGMAVYNKADQTFVFAAPVSLKIIWGFPFEDLPEAARCYIATSAGRRFQSKVIGSQILDRFEEEDEVKAHILLQREERRTRDTNMFRGNAQLAGFGSRRY